MTQASKILDTHVRAATLGTDKRSNTVGAFARVAFVPVTTLRDMRRALAPSVCQFARVCVALRLTPRQIADIVEAAAAPQREGS